MNMIHKKSVERGWESIQAYGRDSGTSDNGKSLRIGSKLSNYIDVFKSRLLDNQGLNSKIQTSKLVRFINEFKPDVVHLHNLHGYYLNYTVLFECLRENRISVIWTLHDAWALTGHCTHFDFIQCEKWKTSCSECPLKGSYPRSWFLDRSSRNHELKKQSFNIDSLLIVSVSKWLDDFVKDSFLGLNNRTVLHNGVDVNIFRPNLSWSKNMLRFETHLKYILAVASPWTTMKGFQDVIKISEIIAEKESFQLVIVGVTKEQSLSLSSKCLAIRKTNNVRELAYLYAKASVFINPTHEDNFPTTNLEALACGTPVVTYDTGGCKEALNPKVGEVVQKGDWRTLLDCALRWADEKNSNTIENCRNWALEKYDADKVYSRYLDLYDKVLKKRLDVK